MLIAFHGQSAIKRKYLARVRGHREADELIHGVYWQDGKGCAVGCTVHSASHAAYENELGIPRALARIEDGIFEGLANGKAKLWPEQFLRAIKVGADLSQVTDRFLHWLLVDPKDGVIKFARTERTRKAIENVGELYARKLKGESISLNEWRNAAAADYAAATADYAAAAYAYSAAATAYAAAADASSAADYAAATADYAAASYAYAASAASYAYAATASAASYAYAATASAATRSKARATQARKLLELLRACPHHGVDGRAAVTRTGRERAAKI